MSLLACTLLLAPGTSALHTPRSLSPGTSQTQTPAARLPGCASAKRESSHRILRLSGGSVTKTVLVTGGVGYIGSHTVLELLMAGYEVVIVDNLCNSNLKCLRRVEKLAGRKAIFYKADVRDKEAMAKVFANHKIDSVIHFAGLKAVGESVALPLLYYQVRASQALFASFIHLMGPLTALPNFKWLLDSNPCSL